MSPSPFRLLTPLTPDQEKAARAYTSESPRLHHLMQGRNGMDCEPFKAELGELALLLPNLVSAARAYELTEPLTLYAGLNNGYSALGSLWHNDPAQLVGLDYTYGGVFSTSVNFDVARSFLSKDRMRRVLLTIDAKPGLRCLPTSVLGPDNSHEGEVLIARESRFRIMAGSRQSDRHGDFVHLTLIGP